MRKGRKSHDSAETWDALEQLVREGEQARDALPKANVAGVSRSDRRKMEAEEVRFCTHCGKSSIDAKLMTCSGCKTAKFCSKDCQRTGWKAHKPLCMQHRQAIVETEAELGARVNQRSWTLDAWLLDDKTRAWALHCVAYLAQHGDIPGIPPGKHLVQPLLRSTKMTLLCDLMPETDLIRTGVDDTTLGMLARVDVDVGYVAQLPQKAALVPQARLRYPAPAETLKEMASLLHVTPIGKSKGVLVSVEDGFFGSFRVSVDFASLAPVFTKGAHDPRRHQP
mmetsp:Transcript_22038/g.67809  ORF Transcript_22038/g.67809 Transcript_22038/m.67809 type:complete len:280 (-) Transcript_22038:382-1221(-)